MLDCKSDMVQEKCSITGGDRRLKGQPQEGPGPHRLHMAFRGSPATHREGLQNRGPVEWKHCKWRQLTQTTDFSNWCGHDGPRTNRALGTRPDQLPSREEVHDG